MSEYDVAVVSLTVAVISAIAAFVAIVYARRQLQFSERVAAAERTFDRPRLVTFLMIKDCPPHIIIPIRMIKGRVNEIPLPLIVKNEGSKTAEQVSVYVRLPKTLAYENMMDVEGLSGSWMKIKNATAVFVPEEYHSLLVFNISRLPTHETLILQFPISIRHSSTITDSVVAHTRDNVAVTVTYKATIVFLLQIISACESVPAAIREYRLEFVDTSELSFPDLLRQKNASALEGPSFDGSIVSRMKHLAKAMWRGSYRRKPVEQVGVYMLDEATRIADPKLPIDRISSEGAKLAQGLYDPNTKRYYIPSLDITASLAKL